MHAALCSSQILEWSRYGELILHRHQLLTLYWLWVYRIRLKVGRRGKEVRGGEEGGGGGGGRGEEGKWGEGRRGEGELGRGGGGEGASGVLPSLF